MLTSQIKDADGHGKTAQLGLQNMCRDNTRLRTTLPRANRFDEKEDIENTKETRSAPRLEQMPIDHYSLSPFPSPYTPTTRLLNTVQHLHATALSLSSPDVTGRYIVLPSVSCRYICLLPPSDKYSTGKKVNTLNPAVSAFPSSIHPRETHR